MKRIISVVSFFLLLLLYLSPVYAKELTGNGPKIKCDIDWVKITLNKKPITVGNIKYDKEIYVRVKDTVYYFNLNLQVNDKAKEVNIIPQKAKSVAGKNNIKPAPQKAADISASINKYIVKCNSLNEFADNIEYKGSVYVSVKSFAEMFDKKVNYKSDGSIEISDIAEVEIGKINGEKITMRDFEYFYNPNVQTLGNAEGHDLEEKRNKLKQDVFNVLVNRKLVLQKAAKQKIQLTSEDIKAINSVNIVNMVNLNGGIANFRKALDGYNISFHQVVLYIRDSYLRDKAINRFVNKVQVSEEKVKKFYDDNKASFTQPLKVTAKHILIKTIDDRGKSFPDDKIATAKNKAEGILESLKNGEDFDKLMLLHSEDPGVKQYPGGYTFGKGEMVKEFEDAAFALNPGELSGLVKTVYGYHIIKLIERLPAKELAYDEVKADIMEELIEIEKSNYYNELLKKWISESKIENKLT